MPQPFESSDELSLRHLPDVSDSSFSFQIPGAIRDDNLLADDDLDFFKGTDVTIAPLASTPPTFSQLTPKPKAEKLPSSKDGRKLGSFPTLSYDHSEDRDTNPKQKKANPRELSKATTNVNVLSKPKPKVITPSSTSGQLPFCEKSPAAVRLDNLRAELNLFSDNLLAGPSTNVNHQVAIHHKPTGILKKIEKKQLKRTSPRKNQKVTEGGITKTRCAITKMSAITSSHTDGADTLLIQQEQNTKISDNSRLLWEQANGDLSFANTSTSSAAAGAAGRLVMYSQQLINSFGLSNSDRSLEANNVCQVPISLDQEAGTDVDALQTQAANEAERPLTLSQLSPQKTASARDPTPTPRDKVLSPLRLPNKRPISMTSNVLQKRKKSKTDASSAEVSVPKPSVALKARLPATKRHPKPISPNSNSELRLDDRSVKRKPTSTRVNGPGIKRPPVFKPEGPELNGDGDDSKDTRVANASASSSRCGASMSGSNEKDIEPVNNKGKSIASSAYHGPQSATIPVPFNFQTDRRGPDVHKDRDQAQDKGTNEATERRESQREKRTTIPDFKAMHAVQEAELALRKENIQPVVPLPIQWETDYRLKERHKFDEKMREKEREQERLMELRRREKEEEEEREVRELRKKAVPKAHEVPEWYREAPKKKKDNAVVGSIGS